ncbi:MAG: ABC transporter permease, partial [Deltaproteobacteria bacterium]|nr:ABC transporter permease [Deltaproteobacteria bacterium]
MRLELALCLRYLRSRQREGSLSLITMVAVVGVTLGVAALVVALSLMNGYQVNMVRAMAGALPHVSISPTRSEGFENLRQVEDLVQKELSPVSISPFVLREVMVSNPRAPGAPVQGVVLRGVEPTRESTSAEFLALLHDDSPGWDKAPKEIRLERAKKVLKALESSKGEGDPVLLSPMLARRLGVKAGDTLIPLRFPKEGGSFSPTPMPVKLLVAGFFETGIPTFDEMVVLMDIGRIGPVFHLKPGDLSLGIRLTDPMLAGESVEKLRFVYPGDGNGFSVFSWLDSNKGLFKVIQTQKVMLGLVLMLIVVIAFFGMVSAMVM